MAAGLIMKNAPAIMGVAIAENAYNDIAVVKALQPEEIEEEGAELLEKAKDLMARLPPRYQDRLYSTSVNCLAGTWPELGRIPPFLPNDAWDTWHFDQRHGSPLSVLSRSPLFCVRDYHGKLR